jgi:hypothetical protein
MAGGKSGNTAKDAWREHSSPEHRAVDLEMGQIDEKIFRGGQGTLIKRLGDERYELTCHASGISMFFLVYFANFTCKSEYILAYS